MCSTKRVLLVGDVGEKIPGWYHIGDEAMVYQNYWLYRRAGNFEITLLTWNEARDSLEAACERLWQMPTGAKGAHEIDRLLYRARWHSRLPLIPISPLLAKYIELIRAHDLIHISGGGNLNSLFPLELYVRALLVQLAKLFNKPVLASSQTIGPLTSVDDERVLLRVLNSLDILTLRDARQSRELVRRLVPTHPRISVEIDDAFFLDPIPFNALAPFWISPPEDSRALRVGISLQPDGKCIADAIVQALNRLAEHRRLEIHFIPHLIVANDQTDDVPYMKQIAARTGEHIRHRVITGADLYDHPEPHKEKIIKGLTGAMDILLATRYHALVFALSSGVPALALNLGAYYATKNLGLLEMILGEHATDYALDAADVTASQIVERLQRLDAQREPIRTTLQNRRAKRAPLRDLNVRLADELISARQKSHRFSGEN